MNKTLLIIICDFLLISVLALVEFKPSVEEALIDTKALRDESAEEMLELLQLSLEHENAQRQEVENLLGDTREELDQKEEQLEQTKQVLEEKEDELVKTVENLESTKDTLERTSEEKILLAGTLEDTRTNLEVTLQEKSQLESSLSLTEAQRRRLQSELQQQQQVVSSREAELAQAQDNLKQLEASRQQMSTELRIVDTERQMLQQNLIAAQAEVERARIEAERARTRSESLAAGVSDLAEKSTALQEEFRQAQPLSMNAIYQNFEQNRVLLRFEWEERYAFSNRKGQSALQTVLLDTGNGIFALFAVENSPLSTDRASNVKAWLRIGNQSVAVSTIGFLAADKRIAAIPVPQETAWSSGRKVFSPAQDPLRFSNAVLIKDDQELYGEIPVRVPPGAPGFLDVETRLFNRLMGEFSPSSGDFVFSMTGELTGIMVEKNRAIIVQSPKIGEFYRLIE